jgi:hypothetical protein
VCRSADIQGVGSIIPIFEDQNQTEPARAQNTRRDGRRARGYPRDLTDAQWEAIAPHLPAQMPGLRGSPRI